MWQGSCLQYELKHKCSADNVCIGWLKFIFATLHVYKWLQVLILGFFFFKGSKLEIFQIQNQWIMKTDCIDRRKMSRSWRNSCGYNLKGSLNLSLDLWEKTHIEPILIKFLSYNDQEGNLKMFWKRNYPLQEI